MNDGLFWVTLFFFLGFNLVLNYRWKNLKKRGVDLIPFFWIFLFVCAALVLYCWKMFQRATHLHYLRDVLLLFWEFLICDFDCFGTGYD